MENMLQEVEAPAVPPIARFVSSAVVATRIFQAVRFNLRDAYVSPEDVAAVAADAFVPQLSDWLMKLFIRPGRRTLLHDVTFKREVSAEESAETES